MARHVQLTLTFEDQISHILAGLQHIARVQLITMGAGHKQLERHAYPGQPSTKAEHVVPVCRCTYHPAQILTLSSGTKVQIWSSFTIHPACRHHGHLANTHLIERMWDDPYGYGVLRDPYDLDDDERR